MDVIALVGPSGTGKSHRALWVANQYKADVIIDDGLLIKDGKIIAGSSAKKEKSRIMAVRRAIFILPGHAEEARKALQREAPNRVLILATSENMVHKIAKILRMPPVSRVIHIEDIASETDMKLAAFHRLKEGKHIIPVPTIELKPHFSGYLVDPLQSFFHRSSARPRRKLGEKSIVRPVFSYYGKLIIDDSVIKSIVKRFVGERDFVNKVAHVRVRHLMDGDEDQGIEVSLEVVLRYGKHIPTLIHQTQEMVKEEIERVTGMVVQEVNIMVRTLYVGAT
ncbi:MAG: Asp23/Gls24 family envelope stress response protein [Schwartzia sp.]|nr:Asp23/Gls24 family envelope stress response protein [Schwartzia sp. (in: firmicutes)]